MTNTRPRIGITTRIDYDSQRFYLSRFYSEAIQSAGAVPVLIPLIPDRAYLRALAESINGVLLPGSDSDVDPMRYGHEPHLHLGGVHPLKDETDLAILEEIEKRGMPVLAICFGMQALNVSRGGTLIQDIASSLPQAINHQQGASRDRASHRVRLADGSLMAELAGRTDAVVNSHHHQAIDVIGRDLIATAWTSDGLVEALEEEGRGDRFVVGVQWHPELGWESDEFSTSLFKQFVLAAGKYRSNVEQSCTAAD